MMLWRIVIAVAVVLAALGGWVAGYVMRGHQATVTVLSGNFYVAANFAEATVDGWSYAITEGVHWQDLSGTWHDSGMPDCLAPVGTTRRMVFGYVPVTGLDMGWRQVVWAACQA